MKKLLSLVLVVILTTALFAGFASAEEDTIKIGMLPKFKGENYFDGCYVGAQEAADALGIELVYDGPNQSEATNAKQVEILTGWLSQDFDAIVVSPCDAEGLAPTLREFQDNGVIVLTFDADAPNDARSLYVNAAPAANIAKALVEVVAAGLMELGFGEDQTARLAMISGSGLDVNQNEWILAIEAYIAENYPWITINCDEVGYLGAEAVGTFALSQYPEVHTLPDDHQRGCLSHCPHRGIPGYRVASHRHADVVGEPHYGYLCRPGLGFVAARRAGNARQAPPPERQHRDPCHGQGHHRYRHRLCVAVVRPVAILQARRRHLDSPVRPAALLCQFLQFHARTRRSHAI